MLLVITGAFVVLRLPTHVIDWIIQYWLAHVKLKSHTIAMRGELTLAIRYKEL